MVQRQSLASNQPIPVNSMCGRYTLHIKKKQLAEALAAEIPEVYEPNYNLGPGQELVSLSHNPDHGRTVEMQLWGLRTPHNFHVNARLESADKTPRFRDSWLEHRCLIPANGFYEWYQDGITKQPYYIYPADERIIYFAGLWFPSSGPDYPRSCVILTAPAKSSLATIHDRMPVILDESTHEDWLTNRLKKHQILELGNHCELAMHTVSRRVNSTQNKDSRLTEATSPLRDDQMMLF